MRIIEDYKQHPVTKKWITQKYDMDKPVDMARYIARIKYAFPGGYELFAIMDDGGLVCSKCVLDNYVNIHHSTKHEYQDGWQVVAICTEAELEDDFCSHCGKEVGYHE